MSAAQKLAFPVAVLIGVCGLSNLAFAKYTTNGQNIVDRETGETVILRGFGLGCWLLPEGYMWGSGALDQPRELEAAIEDLIGPTAAAEFWQTYRDNFLTEADVAAMKSFGVNTLRVALLASMLQPRDDQPDEPPYNYSEEGFAYLDKIVAWCDQYDIGLIWDMHGAPGGQNAENISDSDGVARLWTEKDTYWPRCIELWKKIAQRYAGNDCIVGYDLLNEPLLQRYSGIDPALLRELYVLLTQEIRTIDTEGIIFIEGDEWAQDFSLLEPLDWDPHLVLAFHSYPPTTSVGGLDRWDQLRDQYNIPLWHGETGEQGPPYTTNLTSTTVLQQENVGWSWWTHKKFDNVTQPWNCPRTDGFKQIINYWNGNAARPDSEEARQWLMEQAEKTNTTYCTFLPDMVRSLAGLDPNAYLNALQVSITAPLDYAVLPIGPVQIDASASTAEGTLTSVAFYVNDTLRGTDTTEPYSFTTILDEGCYRLRVEVTNSLGRTAADEISISVGSACVGDPFLGYPAPLPGLVEAEDFDFGGEGTAYHDCDSANNGGAYRSAEGVDIEAASGSNYNVGWMCSGEWLDYTVDVATSGFYEVEARVASQDTGGAFALTFNGVEQSGDLAVPITGGWQTWTTISGVMELAAGVQEMRFVNKSGAGEFNLDWFNFTYYAHHDYDFDGDVDYGDWIRFSNCQTNPDATTPLGACDANYFQHSDADNDNDADMADFAILQQTFSASS